jgi:hypothetical protein
MAKKPSRRYIVILAVCVVVIVSVAALGFLDMRPAGKDASVAVATEVLTD